MSEGALHAEPAGPRELLQLAAVASQYYLDGRSKVEIGQDLGLSRFKVARMLQEARERGIVQIQIHIRTRSTPGSRPSSRPPTFSQTSIPEHAAHHQGEAV